jgi:predicted nucleic acid-binding protein
MPLVLDACAMIAYLRNEKGAEVVDDFLTSGEMDCYAHAINLCEVYYDFIHVSGESAARWAMDALRAVHVHVREDMDEALWQQAAQYKGSWKVALADAFAMALANRLGAEVITSDRREFGPVAQAGICRVKFIR